MLRVSRSVRVNCGAWFTRETESGQSKAAPRVGLQISTRCQGEAPIRAGGLGRPDLDRRGRPRPTKNRRARRQAVCQIRSRTTRPGTKLQPDARAKPLHEPVVSEDQISIGVGGQDPRKTGEPGAKLSVRFEAAPRVLAPNFNQMPGRSPSTSRWSWKTRSRSAWAAKTHEKPASPARSCLSGQDGRVTVGPPKQTNN
jgi:hypothetical protein